ncbi:sigma-70 family RNA polymerase sigma factor [Rhodococcus hoagii]|nr:sigma-70 family RNA polymerase sigma factor [Prescottella equi]
MTERAVGVPPRPAHAARRADHPDATFAGFVDRYGPELRRYCRSLTSDEDTADDVVQETFIAAWHQLGSFRGDASIGTWLYAICNRKIFDLHRRRRPDVVDDEILHGVPERPALEPHVAVSSSAFLTALDRALRELPARQRASWVMREVDAMTYPEIGAALGLSPDAARGQHRRATAALATRLQEWR